MDVNQIILSSEDMHYQHLYSLASFYGYVVECLTSSLVARVQSPEGTKVFSIFSPVTIGAQRRKPIRWPRSTSVSGT